MSNATTLPGTGGCGSGQSHASALAAVADVWPPSVLPAILLPPSLFRLGLAVAALLVIALFDARVSAGEERAPNLQPVSVGFVRHAYGTWTAKIADGGFENATGRTLRWLPFDTDSAVIAGMANGRLDLGLIGTSVVAAGLTRGFDLKVFYVMGGAGDSEGLVVGGDRPFRAGDPKSLQNLVVAVPFGSTPHFRLLQTLKRWGIAPAGVRLVNLQTPQIEAAWGRREIEAAVVSEPLLGELAKDGRLIPLPSAGGQEGLLVFAGAADFVADHMVFLSRFVDVLSRADAAFTNMSGPLDETRNEVKSIAFLTGLTPAAVVAAVARYRPPRLEDQASSRWLGGGAQSALAAELKANAEILRWAGRLDRSDRDFSQAITPIPVQKALKFQE